MCTVSINSKSLKKEMVNLWWNLAFDNNVHPVGGFKNKLVASCDTKDDGLKFIAVLRQNGFTI